MKTRSAKFAFLSSITFCMFLHVASLHAWGPDGHRVVGALALDQLNQHTRNSLEQLMGSDDMEILVEWCNWPDLYRTTEEGAWSTPKHYINMVPGASIYDMERDCSDGMCVTEAVTEYALKLADEALDVETRRQAFAWVCHLVGDLHQPLHAGFGHDRGGNDVDVTFNDEAINLHWFWDGALIADRTESWKGLYAAIRQDPGSEAAADWKAPDVATWTNESHAFAEKWSYPGEPVISEEFADQSWERLQRQLNKGGSRLASVLNTVLGRKCHHHH